MLLQVGVFEANFWNVKGVLQQPLKDQMIIWKQEKYAQGRTSGKKTLLLTQMQLLQTNETKGAKRFLAVYGD